MRCTLPVTGGSGAIFAVAVAFTVIGMVLMRLHRRTAVATVAVVALLGLVTMFASAPRANAATCDPNAISPASAAPTSSPAEESTTTSQPATTAAATTTTTTILTSGTTAPFVPRSAVQGHVGGTGVASTPVPANTPQTEYQVEPGFLIDPLPLNGILVRLLAAGGDDTFGTADDYSSASALDAAGNYAFSGLVLGSYRVTITGPAGPMGTWYWNGGNANQCEKSLPGWSFTSSQSGPFVLSTTPMVVDFTGANYPSDVSCGVP